MSVKRYEYRHGELSDEHYNHPPAGEFVRWEDYDALRRAVIAVDNRNAALQAEVERLRKAGDELVYWVGCDEYPERVITEWKAAKEGKPSV